MMPLDDPLAKKTPLYRSLVVVIIKTRNIADINNKDQSHSCTFIKLVRLNPFKVKNWESHRRGGGGAGAYSPNSLKLRS